MSTIWTPQHDEKVKADLHRVHLVARTLKERAYYPEHDPRTETPAYKAVHKRLCYDQDKPCWICGITASKGGQMETHHWLVEWSLGLAMDSARVALDVSDVPVQDEKAFMDWVDHSEENLLVLCAEHHRHNFVGIHAITFPIWRAQRYVKAGFDVTGGDGDAAKK